MLTNATHSECIQFFAHPTPVESLGAFVTFHSPGHAHQAIDELRQHALHNNTLGAQMVSAVQQPGYYLPPNLVLPTRPLSNFRVIIGSKPNEPDDGLNFSRSVVPRNIRGDVLSSYVRASIYGDRFEFHITLTHGRILLSSTCTASSTRQSLSAFFAFALLIVSRCESSSHTLMLDTQTITRLMTSVCVQVWRARSSHSLHAFITFLSRPHAQWAASELHGRQETHTWMVRPMPNSELDRCARPLTEQERLNARLLSDAQNNTAVSRAIPSSTTRLAFSATAVIIPFYAALLPPSPCEPHSIKETSHDTGRSRDCVTPQAESYAPPSTSRDLAVLQYISSTPKRPRSCGIVTTSEVSSPQSFRADLTLPRLHIDPGTPRVASAHTEWAIIHAPPILRARSQPVVSLFRSREQIVQTPKIPRVETTLFAHNPVVEQDSSLDLSSDSVSSHSKDQQNRFDPFDESRRTDFSVHAIDAMELLGLRDVPEKPMPVSKTKSKSSVLVEETNTLSLEGRIKRRAWQFRPLNT